MKKYFLLMILLNTSFVFSQYLPNMTNMTETEKMMLFHSEKKDPALAVGFSVLLPSAGHAYIGNWKRGLLFQGGKFVAIALTEMLIVPMVGANIGEDEVIGRTIAIVVLGTIWELADVAKQTKLKNISIYKNIFGKEPNLNIGFIPHTNGANIVFSLNL
jgi:hypothetical protein